MRLAQWDLASGTDFHAEARAVARRTFRSGRSGAAGNHPCSIPNGRFSYRTRQHIFDVPGKLA